VIQRLTRFTRPINYLGLPSLAIPQVSRAAVFPWNAADRRSFDEATLLRIGAAFQRSPITTTGAIIRMTQLVEIRDLNIRFTGERIVHAVNNLSLSLGDGEVLGCSVSPDRARASPCGADAAVAEQAHADLRSHRSAGPRCVGASGRSAVAFRGQTVSMIFQEPALALDPVYTIGHQIAETVMRHEAKATAKQWRARSKCSTWCVFPPPGKGSTPIRTRCPVACGNAR